MSDNASLRPYLHHHKRFLVAILLGAIAFASAFRVPPEARVLVAGDTFFLVYLVLVSMAGAAANAATLRRRAAVEDEGIAFIVGLTAAAIVFSLVSIFAFLNKGGGPDGVGLALALVSVPLGWLTLHTMAAHHYANLYYAPRKGEDGTTGDQGGLDFPGGEAPVVSDFLYFSLVVGMTAQVSDVEITSSRLRKVALAHSVASFFFNTVLVAVAVNAAVVGAN